MLRKFAFPICFVLLRFGIPIVQLNTFGAAAAEVW